MQEDYKRSPAWPKDVKWYPDDYVPLGGRFNPRWEEWIKDHPKYEDRESE